MKRGATQTKGNNQRLFDFGIMVKRYYNKIKQTYFVIHNTSSTALYTRNISFCCHHTSTVSLVTHAHHPAMCSSHLMYS